MSTIEIKSHEPLVVCRNYPPTTYFNTIGQTGLIFCAKQEEYAYLVAACNRASLFGSNRVVVGPDQTEQIGNKHFTFRPLIFSNDYVVWLTYGPGQGPEQAAVACTTLAHQLRPSFMIMVGILAKNPNKENIAAADVIVAKAAFNYEEGKRTDDGFLPDTRLVDASDKLLASFDSLEGTTDLDWNKIHRGVVISGSAVRADDKLVEEVKKRVQGQVRQIVGLEMEISAFYTACDACGVPALAFKGVSDDGTASKSDDFHAVCIEQCCNILRRLIPKYMAANLKSFVRSEFDVLTQIFDTQHGLYSTAKTAREQTREQLIDYATERETTELKAVDNVWSVSYDQAKKKAITEEDLRACGVSEEIIQAIQARIEEAAVNQLPVPHVRQRRVTYGPKRRPRRKIPDTMLTKKPKNK